MAELDLHINKRLKNLLPSLAAEERKQLAANIKADGRVTDPLLYWFDGKQNVVVDGMHRFEIARRESIPYRTEHIEIGKTYEDVELWILNRQLGRRNLISPQAQRKLRGELYNRLKRKNGDGRGPEGQFVPLVKPPAKTVADMAGVDERTVKRDGARVEALEKCTPSVQKGVNTGTFKVLDAEIKTLAALSSTDQNTIAMDLRKGLATTVNESMKLQGIKSPAKKPKPKPPKKLDKKAYFKQYMQTLGPLSRLVDKIANDVGEKHGPSHTVIVGQLAACTEKMQKWMGVE